MLVDSSGRLAGIFTDSDLARLFEHHRDNALDAPIHSVMTANPLKVAHGSLMSEAVALMAQRKISELPVVDGDGRPVGLIDVTDVVGMFPQKAEGGRRPRRRGPRAGGLWGVTQRVNHPTTRSGNSRVTAGISPKKSVPQLVFFAVLG